MSPPVTLGPFAALLIDMDGTVITSLEATERVWTTWALSRGIDPEPFLPTIHGVQATETVRRLGRPDLDPVQEAAILTEMELADLRGVASIAGAEDFLGVLPPDRWAIVTSAPRELARRRLTAAGLAIPPVLVTAEGVPRGKPAPDCFLQAAARLGVSTAACLVVEDSAAGIQAGEAAGASVLVITAVHQHRMETSHTTLPSFAGVRPQLTTEGLYLALPARAV